MDQAAIYLCSISEEKQWKLVLFTNP